MTTQRTFERHEEKRWPDTLQWICWAKKRDLFAGASTAGDVFISRMSWKRVWNLKNSKFDQAQITALAWKPDATMLAIGTSLGKVYIHDVETSELVHVIQQSAPASSFTSPRITTLYWVDDVKINQKTQDVWQDSSRPYTDYLPSLSALPRPGAMVPQIGRDELKAESMHVLVVGDDQGRFSLNVDGAFHLGTTSLLSFQKLHLKDTCIIGASLTPDLTILSLAITAHSASLSDGPGSPLATPTRSSKKAPTSSKEPSHDFYIATIDTNLLHFRKNEVCALAFRSTQANVLLNYLDDAVKLLDAEYDNVNSLREQHIRTFVRILSDYGTGSTPYDEMMTMLWVGHRSGAIRQYLQHDLGERVLTKWENTVETAYLAMKKLIIINLRPGAQRLLLFLTELYGLSRFEEQHQQIGLNMSQVQFCLKRAGHLMAALDRLMTVLQDDMKNFTQFGGWLRNGKSVVQPAESQEESAQWDTKRIAKYLSTSFQHDILGSFFTSPTSPDVTITDATATTTNESAGFFYDLESETAKASLITIMSELRSVCNTIFDVPAAFMGSNVRLAGFAKVITDMDATQKIQLSMRLVNGPNGMVQYLAFQDPTFRDKSQIWIVRFNAQLRKPPKGFVSGYESPSSVKWSGEAVRLLLSDSQNSTPCEVQDLQLYDDDGLVIFSKTDGQQRLYMFPSYTDLPYRPVSASGLVSHSPSILTSSGIPPIPINLESPYSIDRFDVVSLSVHKDFASLLHSDKVRIRTLAVTDQQQTENDDDEEEGDEMDEDDVFESAQS
ncbi:hypothetical protein SmJEL517_g00432 [Synchytrium microbalum]|uniref:Anaphase-promoting complex subunit 4 n=1 Tax=Synchytrium microbalum TaxID=1806994 RepID=A0A507CHR6_9FUNG|nr:uncharacterized protein SmJEL517_g00432 [Synchytrium microbalum]TPX37656.1 hypothetical protein SmJEL517_g00432 [Synchytrium microbalum]